MIAFAQILKDTEPVDMVARCWYSVLPYVDASYITVNGKTDEETPEAKKLIKKLKELAKERGYKEVTFDYIKWEKDFSKARNHNFEQVDRKYDYILWLDADDILRGGAKLHEIEDLVKPKDIGAVFFNYLYRVDTIEDKETGKVLIKNILIEHLRERLVRNDGRYKWIAPIHETLIPQRQTNQTDSQSCDVVHMSTDERGVEAIQRNKEILELQLESQGKQQDPRTLYYLGKTLFDLRSEENWDRADVLFDKYLNGSETNTPSGWGEERAQCWEYKGEIRRERGIYNEAIKCIANALIEDPKFPNFYIDMALIFGHKQDWEKAKFWAKLSQSVPYPKTTLVSNPRDMQARILEVLFNAAVNTNDLKGAHAAAIDMEKLLPDVEIVKKRREVMEGIIKQNEAMTDIVRLANYLKDRGQDNKINELVKSIPAELESDPLMISLRRDFTPKRIWENNEIALICGKGFEIWSPKNLAKGIGGSEEAVIYLSKELTKMGWRVTVFADPGDDKGIYDGVTYLPYYYFNPKDAFNVLIGWRGIGLYDQDWDAKRTYLWLHDIQNNAEYTKERVDRITKIFALSKWHRDNMPSVSDDKFMLTGNGINLDYFFEIDKKNIERNTHRMIWTSSYDRGLEHLLTMWPDVIKEVPDAELHIFYGWNLFESFYRNNPERMAWKEKLDKLMTQKGITHHGRVGQKEVIEETFKSGLWAYPTHFGEISCITAMKCQAAGAIPVVCDYAALKETAKYGVKINVDKEDIYSPEIKEEYKNALIKALKDVEWQESIRPEMMKWARDNFSWEKIAKQWNDEFIRDDQMEAANTILAINPDLEKYLPYKVQERMGKDVTY